ncbi:MAG: twin-arginine translocase TatA/TatE family subunit [Bdellovibrionales bacterium]|nr:twin-arginine translocase TatA/TatE family subunit [Bdellovibrionales bacterium]
MSVGPWQLIIVLGLILLVFGPKRIPAIGKSLGEAFRGFKKGITGDDERDITPENEKLSEKSGSSQEAKVSEKDKHHS